MLSDAGLVVENIVTVSRDTTEGEDSEEGSDDKIWKCLGQE